jgi:F420H(2)-dependent quinone reductase
MRAARGAREDVRERAIRLMGRTHRLLYRAAGGRVGGRIAGMPVLLLTTHGRRSGKARTTPLTFLRDGGAYVVIASFGGSDRSPGWSWNLRDDPEATVLIGRRRQRVAARETTAAEREQLWPVITRTYDGYARYQERTNRRIQVFLLTPRADNAVAGSVGA